MSKFKVGDRVVAYAHYDYTSKVRWVGTIDYISPSGYLQIFAVDDESLNPLRRPMMFHLKQCRKLKKKERRRVWVNVYPAHLVAYDNFSMAQTFRSEGGETVEFVEVKKK